MESISIELLLFLVAIATLPGAVDAIAGGGGLITLPALLWAGLPPVQALATNKLQGGFGTLSASMHFLVRGQSLLPGPGQVAGTWPCVMAQPSFVPCWYWFP
jgi:uncharacterized membrane protein YfcA